METENTKKIYFRVTQDEYDSICNLSASCGLLRNDYIRARVLGYSPPSVLPESFFRFINSYNLSCSAGLDSSLQLRLDELLREIYSEYSSPLGKKDLPAEKEDGGDAAQ